MAIRKQGFVRAKVNRKIAPGEMLRTLRELQNLTQQELADKPAFPNPTSRRWRTT